MSNVLNTPVDPLRELTLAHRQARQGRPGRQGAVQCTHVSRGRQCGNKIRSAVANPLCHVHTPLEARVQDRPLPPRVGETPAPAVVDRPLPRRTLSTEPADCPVCMESKLLRTFDCGHGMCEECLGQLRDYSCSLCRSFIASQLTKIELDGIVSRKVRDGAERIGADMVHARTAQLREAYVQDLHVLNRRHQVELRELQRAHERRLNDIMTQLFSKN